MMKRVFLVAIAAASLWAAQPVDAASISERTTYFTLRGSTLPQLDRELNRKGPSAGTAGDRHPGATQVSFGGRVTYAPSGGACRVGRTDFTLRLVKILPRWTPARSSSAATVIVWRTLSQDIYRHEEDHARIARRYVRQMESAVRNLGPRSDCRRMEAAVNATTTRYLTGHERAQLDFDRVEGREVNRRLKRLLQQNIDKALAARRATN
jgi:predicted secreted Zn-dependent protease